MERQRTRKNIENAFKKGKRGYNAIKTFAVFTAENPDSQSATSGFNKKQNHSLLQTLKQGGYVIVPARGKFGNEEHPYIVLNISQEAAAYYCGQFQQTSFVYHVLNDDGLLHSEYWEKKDPEKPYNQKTNNYVKKDESDEWIDETNANDFYTSVGRDFKYSIPFETLLEYNNRINENLNRIIAIEKQKGVVHTKDQLMEFAMYRVGQSPWLHRKSINRVLL